MVNSNNKILHSRTGQMNKINTLIKAHTILGMKIKKQNLINRWLINSKRESDKKNFKISSSEMNLKSPLRFLNPSRVMLKKFKKIRN